MFSRLPKSVLGIVLVAISFNVSAQLSGNYTINPSGSGSKNYKTFGDAVSALNSNGVGGAVVFNVANRTFTEQISFNYVSGSSSSNTITFRGADSSKAIIRYAASQYGAVIKVNAANFFRFEKMTIESTDNTYGYGVHVTAGAEDIKISNCIVKASTTSGSADCIPINISGVAYNTNGANGENITVENCIINGGYYAINMRGTNTSLLSETLNIDNCTFGNQYYTPIYAEYVSDINLTNCTIDNIRLGTGIAVYYNTCTGGSIMNNKIYPGRFGLYLSLHNYYNRSDSLLIVNNEISDFADASYNSGIYSNNCYSINAYHNTVLVNGSVSSPVYSAAYFSAPLNHRIFNNSFASNGNSDVFYLGAGSFGTTKIDYNNYKVGSGGLIYWQNTNYTDLGTLQSNVNTQNQNSTDIDPGYTGYRNLVPVNPGMNNVALGGLSNNDLAGNSRPKSPDVVPDIGAYEYYISPYDIDLIDIYHPIIANTGSNTISVVFKNNGSVAVTDTVTVHYQVGSGTWVKDTAYFSNFAIGATDTFYFTKTWNPTNKGTYQVCAAISPVLGGDPDSLVGDTFCTFKCIGQQGTFTIDPSGNGDYKTFTDAVSTLDCGISGPIKFLVKAGTYSERITISQVLGASKTNTITFEGVSKDSVTLVYAGTSSLPAVVLLDGADNISFKNIYIKNTSSAIGAGFWLRNESNNVTIDNCNIDLDSTARDDDKLGIVAGNALTGSTTILPGNKSSNITITNNRIRGGSYGIRLNGVSTSFTSDNNIIKNNIIRGQYYDGILTTYIGRTIIRKNRIVAPRNLASVGIQLYYCNRDTIDGNVVQSGRFGIYSYLENYYDQNGFSLFSNNMVSNLLDPTYQSGIWAYYNYNSDFYHNSVWTTHSYNNWYYSAMLMYNNNNCNVKNNAIKAENGALAFSSYYGTVNITSINNNCYYSDGTAKYNYDGLVFADLATWKAVTSNQNSNSIEGKPGFTSSNNLHISGSLVNNAGQSGLDIDFDIDGNRRPFSPDKKVDIGADEFYVSPYDLDLIALDSPIVPSTGNNSVVITLKNTGIKDLTNDTAVVSYSVNSGTPVKDTLIIASLAANASLQYTFQTDWNISSNKTYTICAKLDTFYQPDPDTSMVQEKCRTACPGAIGNFTIDPSGNGDFKTFKSALNSLQCGISGPVNFTVKKGTYNERLEITEIDGASASSRITFVGEDRNTTVINYVGQKDSQAVVHLRGADYFTFKNMTLSNSRAIWSNGVYLTSNADYNEFTDVTINMNTSTTNGTSIAIYGTNANVAAVGVFGNHNSFNNVNINGAYYGVRMDGEATTTLAYGNSFTNCQFSDNAYYNVYAIYLGQLTFNKCRFLDTRIEYFNVYLNRTAQTTFTNNYIESGRRGLYSYLDNYYFQEETSEFSNNMFVGGYASTTTEMIDFYYSYNAQFFYNSINFTDGNGGYALRFSYGSGHDVRNNSISKSTTGELMETVSAAFVSIDYNNYYKGSSSNYVTYNGTSYNSLSQWKTGVNGFNKNSRDGDPKYNSSTDLTVQPKSTQLANWGSIINSVTEDFEGDIRNTTNPDIGADEYSDLYDLGVTALVSPTNSCDLTSSENIVIQVKNLGGIDVLQGEIIPFEYQIDGGTTFLDTFQLTSVLKTGDSINLLFDQKYDFSLSKTYGFKAWTNIANDSNRNNDSFSTSIKSFEEPKANFSFVDECTVDGTKFTDGSSVTTSSIAQYAWKFGDGNNSTAKNPTNVYASAGNFSPKLVITTSQGCKDSVTKSVDIGLKPTASFTSNGLCFGDSTAFNNTSSIATASNANFAWDFDDSKTASSINPKHQYAATGSYNVELIATAANGCSDTATNTIAVSATPSAAFNVSDVCFGTNAQFNNTSNIPTGFTPTYTWNFGDASSSNSTSPSKSYGTVGDYTVELNVTLNNGCSDDAQDTVTVESTPVADFTTADVCDGQTATFTNTSSIGSGSISSNAWDFDDGKSSTSQSPSHLYASKGSYDVKLVTKSIAGCSDSLTTTIVVNEKPSAAFSVSTECAGDATKFTNSSTVGVGNISNAWSFGDGFNSTASAPSHTYATAKAYSAQLIVTSDSGCTDTTSKSATVYANPQVAFGVTNLCFGDTLRPSNSSTISSGSISGYAWDFDDGNTSTLASPENKYTAKGSYNVKLVATSNNNCKDSLSKQVVVDNVLVPGYSATTVCLGDSTSFTNTTNTSCGTISSYVWEFGDGKTSTDIAPKHKYAAAGTYSVMLIVTQQGGAKDTSTQNVTVNGLPTVNFSTANVCTGKQASFTNSSTIGSGSISGYTWDFGDGNKDNTTNANHTYSNDGTYSVKLVATSNAGCADSTSKNITAYELPVADFDASAVCLGKAVKYNNKSSISTGTITYSWDFGDGFSSTQTSPSYTYSTAKTYNVKLTVTSNNSCVADVTKSLAVNPNPSLAFSVVNACANEDVKFINSSSISSGSSSYKWYFGDGDSSSAVQPAHTYGSAGSYTAKLVGTSNKGCESTLSKTANAYATPTANFNIPASCTGTKLSFSNTSSISAGTMTYAWNFGDGNASTSTSPTHTYASTGNYNVKLVSTSNNGCIDSTIKLAKVYDLPTASFSAANICSGDSTAFSNSSSIASGSMSYVWNFGDGTTSNKTSPKHKYAASGSYQVKLVVTSNWGCKDSSTQTVVISPAPNIAFSGSEVCFGNTTAFTNTTSISSGTLTWFWDFDNGAASTLKSPSQQYATSGNYDVTLFATSNRGCKDSLTKTIAVNPNPVVKFNYFNKCFGDTTQFVNTTSISSGTITYAWDFDDGNTSIVSQPKNYYNSTGSYNVELIAKSNKGCSDTKIRTLNLNATPVVAYTAPNVCEGNAVNFGNKSSLSSGTYISNWNFGDGTSSALTSPTHMYSTSGSYNTVLTVVSDSGCTDSFLKTVAVNAKPSAAFRSTDVCEGKASSFSDNSNISSGSISTYAWSFGDGFTDNKAINTHTYANDGSYNVQLIVTSDSSCGDTATKTVEVYSSPKAAFSATNICFGDTLKPINNSSISSGSITKHAWDFGDGGKSNLISPAHYFTNKGSYNVKLVLTSNNNCMDSIAKKITADIVVVPGFTFSDVCDGETVSFTNTTNSSCGNITGYTWSFGDGKVSNASNPSHTYSKAGKYTVMLVVDQASGATDTSISDVEVFPLPNVSFSTASVCQNVAANFTNASSIASGSISSYEWNMGDGSKLSATSPSHQYANKGNYTVQLKATSNEGCADSTTKNISIYEVPNASFVTNNVCHGDDVQFSNRSSISSGPLGSTWNFGDATTSTTTNPSKTYTNAGNYTVWLKVESNNGCLDSVNKVVSSNPIPNALFGALETCEGDASAFYDSSTVSAGNILSRSWNFGDGFTSSQTNPTHLYSKAGSYNVSLVVTSDSGCADTTIISSTVNASPKASFSTTNLCLGDKLTPKNTSTISSGTITGNFWDFDNGDTSLTKSPSYTYATKGSYNVKLVNTSNKGCKDSTTHTVVVDVVIVPGFNATTACAGDSTNFTNTTNVSCGNVSGYDWNFGDGKSSTASDPKHLFASAGNYNVRLIVTQQGGAKDTITKSVTVNYVPTVNFFGSNSCAQTQVSFTNLSTLASGTISNYEWDYNDGYKDNVKNPKHAFSNAGTYAVKLKAYTSTGCVDSASRSVSIYELPKVSFTANDVCFGEAVNFSNNSSIGTGTINYEWNFGDGFSSSAKSPNYTYSTDGTYDVDLKATSNNFCVAQITKSVNVKSAPNVAFSAPDTCAGMPIRFSNGTTTSSGTPGYNWTFSNGGSSTAELPTYAFANSGIYTIKLKATSVDGCTDSVSKSITVISTPQASFTYSSICPEDKVQFTNTSTSTLPLAGQVWQFTAIDTAMSKSPSYKFNGAGPHVTILYVANIAGCIDSVHRNIQFQSVPKVAFTPGTSCERDTTQFTNNTTVANGTATYSWDFGDGTTSIDNNPEHYYTASSTRIVKLVATSDKGCADSLSLSLSVLDAPDVDFISKGQCADQTVNFSNQTSNLSSNTYSWSFGDGNNSTDQDASNKYSTAGSYSVTLMATNANCSDTAIKNISILAGPQNLTFEFDDACEGDTVFYNNKTANPNLTYKWYFFDGTFSTDKSPKKYYPAAGKFPVGFEAREGSCADSTYQMVEIYEKPDAYFTHIVNDKTAQFTNLDSNYYDYEWNFGDGNSSTLQNPSHTYATDGTYNVTLKVTNLNDCISEYTAQVTILKNSIQVPGSTARMSMYPNPFVNLATVEFELTESSSVTLEVFDLMGKKLETIVSSQLTDGTYQYEINADAYSIRSSVYQIRLTVNGYSQTERLIKLK